ncbi:MAG: hypothetical protein K2Z81_09735 [Cyanobacteria bacterium]|nr:hypothetical protein [Cyanobacteriota bacterium]
MKAREMNDEIIDRLNRYGVFDQAVNGRFEQPYESLPLIHEVIKRHPNQVRDAAVYLHDTLDLCQLACEALFGDKAQPELTLAIYDRLERLLLRMAPSVTYEELLQAVARQKAELKGGYVAGAGQ